MVDDNSCVCASSIFQDASDYIVGEVENHVGANRANFFSLRKAMQLLRHSRYPQVFQSWVIHELCLLGDSFLRDWMNNAIADLFNVDVMLKYVRGGSEVLGDCVTRWIVECQVDYIVEGMDGNAGGSFG